MARLSKIGKHETQVYEGKEMTYVRYHFTDVVKFSSMVIVLDTGGWYTPTTKTRMNQTSNYYGLGYYVYQKKGIWYVDFKDTTYVFKDGMKLYR